jgi:GrpB-like predicted nucleotidyltransferase (UPF0157 family)
MPPHPGPKDGGDVLPYVKIVSYDQRWPLIFEVEKQRILMLSGNKVAAVEHFGSTAIPRICAKPCIDMLVGLNHWGEADDLQRMFSRLDYHYIAGLEIDWRILGRTGRPHSVCICCRIRTSGGRDSSHCEITYDPIPGSRPSIAARKSIWR